jgi:alpha-beta hydrolase superfamily lysophospholipase
MSHPREEEESVAHETFFLSRPSSSSLNKSGGGGSRNVFVRIDRPSFCDDSNNNNNKRVNLLLIFSHGLHEHSSRFEKTFTFWAKQKFNFACVSFDHIGHGRSDGLKCKHQIESFEQCVEDFRAVIAHARERFGFDVPVALAGVSLGGLFALHAAMTYPKDFFFAIVLIAPAINVKWTAQKKALALVGEVIAKATPNMKVVPATTLESLTEDAGTAREFEEDPLNYVGKARARFGNEILKAMKGLEKASREGRLDGISRNVFAVHAEKDAATCAESTERLFSRSLKSIPNKQFVKLTHTKGHLLLHEPGCEWTRALIGRFLLEALVMTTTRATTTEKYENDDARSLKPNDVLFSSVSKNTTRSKTTFPFTVEEKQEEGNRAAITNNNNNNNTSSNTSDSKKYFQAVDGKCILLAKSRL